MIADSQTVCSKFSLIWEIKNFRQYLELKREKLESPHFKIRCSETTKWCLSLRTRKAFLDCCLNRLHKVDDLSDIQVAYKMYVVDEHGNSHFEKSNIVTLSQAKRVIKVKGFLECNSLEERHWPNNTLNLQCDLELVVDQAKTSEWNCNNHLISLSNDLMQLYGMEEISDEIVTFEEADYQVHSFILNARCPQLSSDIAQTYNSSASDSTETSYTDSSAEQAIAISPMRALGYYSYRSENAYIPRYPMEETHVDNRIDDIFTRPVYEAALRYLYSGKVDVNDHENKSRLHVIAGFYGLLDLQEKLEDVAHTCFAVTDIAVDKMRVLFDKETFSQWAEVGFRPITRLINLAQTPYLRYLSVTFAVQGTINWGDTLEVSCRFVKGRFPITLKVKLELFYSEINREETFVTGMTFDSDTIWKPFVAINLKPKGTYFICTFSACNTELKNVLKQEYFINSVDSSHGKSLRNLSLDMANALHKTRSFDFDLNLIAKGKLVKAHRTILYARSPVFREEMLLKMQDENRIVHLVRGIEHDVLRKLVDYIYTGNVNLKDFSKVKELGSAAKRYGLSELANACSSYLETDSHKK